MPHIIRNEYLGAPGGVCFVCHASRRDDEAVVDFIVDVEDLTWPSVTDIPGIGAEIASGALQICESCITPVALELGMFTPRQYHTLETDFNKLVEHTSDLEDKLGKVQKFVEALEAYNN